MSENTEVFTGRVEDYQKYRLPYPAALIELLTSRCGLLREHLIADIGAGTGMLSQLFLEYGNAVVAVEPNAGMRAVCERLASAWPGLTVMHATAEATGLEDASVDFVAAGRAIHWFDQAQAAKEFRRILRPEGRLLLAYNGRALDDTPQSQEYEALLREHGTEYDLSRARYTLDPYVDAFFAGGEFLRDDIRGEQRLTREELLGQTQSLSFAPKPGDPKYQGMQQALREFYGKWQDDGIVVMSTVCRVACGRFGHAA